MKYVSCINPVRDDNLAIGKARILFDIGLDMEYAI